MHEFLSQFIQLVGRQILGGREGRPGGCFPAAAARSRLALRACACHSSLSPIIHSLHEELH